MEATLGSRVSRFVPGEYPVGAHPLLPLVVADAPTALTKDLQLFVCGIYVGLSAMYLFAVDHARVSSVFSYVWANVNVTKRISEFIVLPIVFTAAA